MSAAPTTLAALRSLLAVRFPEKIRRTGALVPTGVGAVDEALGGGLPAGRITELVSETPGTGGQTVLAQLLRTTRLARQRLALIDGADGFAPAAVPADALRHLVWVRGHPASEAFAAADAIWWARLDCARARVCEASVRRTQNSGTRTTWRRQR